MTYIQALRSYQRAQQSAMSPRIMEKTVFARAISLLMQAADNIDDYQAYAAALKFNQRLWTYIQSSLSENSGEVPGGIRTSLLNLSLFIDQQTLRALADPEAQKLDALIHINREIS
ncbi:MAG TPA: flagellar biosynthesis regulatory protein FlaF, partial [Rhodospirillales bacterium]|nr:flagellar biosynthesis regulatory protein FlaF [Rhodospirillales bacterium]